MKQWLSYVVLLCLTGSAAFAQMNRAYEIHRRGMLNETVYNTGELGRLYSSSGTTTLGIPSFEWPANSSAIIDQKQYTGQQNSFGGGVHLATYRQDTSARLYAFCGAASDIVVENTNSIPISIQRIENYPVLADGRLNPDYNPNEAEEKIISKWTTRLGITITRTSRAWSFPDYDDFIIFEYEFENTGDTDGNPLTPGRQDTLTDVMVNFAHGFGPGKFGYERTFNRWNGGDYQNNDLMARFDRNRWMNYVIDRNGKPERTYFAEWATTKKYGGGLLTPQAVGYLTLYYDTLHLMHKGETRYIPSGTDTLYVWDANLHIKQPYSNRLETTLLNTSKATVATLDITLPRKNGVYKEEAVYGADWLGRGFFNWRQALYFGTGHFRGFGPYKLLPGEKINITMAEVAGYGAARLEETMAGLKDEGGSCGQSCGESGNALYAFFTVPNWWQTISQTISNRVTGSDYLSTYSLPDYVNSNVVTVREVADRAIQAYTGEPLVDHDTLQFWPERYSPHGVYAVPVPVPGPSIAVKNTSLGENQITWGPEVESFTASTATLDHYEILKASHPMGPWAVLATVGKGDPKYFASGSYQFLDQNTRIGDFYYYSVVSVDNNGGKSGRTNMTLQESAIGAAQELGTVYVTPNPFIAKSKFPGAAVSGSKEDELRFYNLPKQCTIRIISYSGQLIETIEHNVDKNQVAYFQVTRNNQMLASGVYFYVVETPDGSRTHGKFIIIN